MSTYKIQESFNCNGTCLQGYYNANYHTLVEILGEPHYTETSGDGKVDVEWNLKVTDNFKDESYDVTIYNWKDYDGGNHCRNASTYEWHIGGKSRMSAVVLKDALNELIMEEVA